MTNNRCLMTLGLAQRARMTVSGETEVLDTIKKDKAKLIFLAHDAGVNTSKRFRDKASFHGIPMIETFDSMTISKAIGKENRKVIAVLSPEFAKLILSQHNE
ncbi:MAG: ribosomal L7Ae/L30e/S12e/Gadd45 family protein [Bacilli bacterium]|nr:ribosomal L7Ae/L30e/S12e/Gadd45 family protein [Bacilli bacterium]MBN2697055.1 ribosomal L7Ae/L30e/S12e/Gadd45 family protein [Bacilli bacterium]